MTDEEKISEYLNSKEIKEMPPSVDTLLYLLRHSDKVIQEFQKERDEAYKNVWEAGYRAALDYDRH